jgi:phosphatidate cytidylyltransferase
MLTKLTAIIAGLFILGAAMIFTSHILKRGKTTNRKKDWAKFGVLSGLVATFIIAANTGRIIAAVPLAIIAVVGAYEICKNTKVAPIFSVVIFIICASLFFVLLGHLIIGNETGWAESFLFIFLLVTTCDSFSQLWGYLLGRHKLCPTISPGKTWEGSAGGIISTMAGALLFSFLLPALSTIQIISLGSVIALSAIIGDLIFSTIKRKLNIKDFSGIIPGHGGVLDRYDSLITAAPAAHWFLVVVINPGKGVL